MDDWGIKVRAKNNRVWLMGAYAQSIVIRNKPLVSNFSPEYFLAEFITPGFHLLDAENIVNNRTGTYTAMDFDLNHQGDLYLNGYYNGSGTLNPLPLPTSMGNSRDVFISKIGHWNIKKCISIK